MFNKIDKIPEIEKLFNDGWGSEIAVALLNATEKYILYFESKGLTIDEYHIRDIQNLIILFRAVIKDITSIDLDNPESF